MKKRESIFIAAMSALLSSTVMLNAGQLSGQFAAPPDEYRPWVYSFRIDGNINRAGVTSGVEAIKRAGLGGATMLDVSVGPQRGPVLYNSKEWREIVQFTCQEAGRLGLQLGWNITEGFNAAGGPWITPENSMQAVCWSETNVVGSVLLKCRLAKPEPVYSRTAIDFYEDIKTVAFPSCGTGRLTNIDHKSGVPPKHPAVSLVAKRTPDSAISPADIIEHSRIIDITDKVDREGNLTWQVPDGEWTILRMGRRSTGSVTRPANPATSGLECDKLYRAAVKIHFDALCQPVLDMPGVMPGKVLKFLAVDSMEAGAQNWSSVLPAEFEKRRGYSLYRYLPVLTGRVIDSIEISERFLWDYRRTIADCMRDHFFVYLQQLCAQHGMQFFCESFTRSTFDDSEVSELIGLPAATLWNDMSMLKKSGMAYNNARWASSAAHISGTKVVEAEAFTAHPEKSAWTNHPFLLKPLGDFAYCNGVNHFIFHCFAFQPWEDKINAIHVPGMSFGKWGTQYSQHNTWWNQGKVWQQYQTRCNFMLQYGRYAADVVYLTGEGAPGNGITLPRSVNLADGYNWDMCSSRAVVETMFVRNNLVCVPSGMQYRLLVLPEEMDAITPQLLTKVTELVQAGAHVLVKSRPKHAQGLSNYPFCDQTVSDLVEKLWQNLDGETVKEKTFGAGKIYWGLMEEQILKKLGVAPDFIAQTQKPIEDYPLDYIHRHTEDTDIYFVASFQKEASSALCSFRITGKRPELWYPDSGRIEPCAVYEQRDGRTWIPLCFDPYGSVFVVFRDVAASASVTQVERNGIKIISTSSLQDVKPQAPVRAWTDAAGAISADFYEPGLYRFTFFGGKTVDKKITKPADQVLDASWTVSFPSGSDAPQSIGFDRLIPWNEHGNENIRYFSGTAVYRQTFDFKGLQPDERAWLDLGNVQVIAEVTVNGKELGILWKPPFRVDVTDALAAGTNRLEIRVTNLWANRLIRDEQFPPDFERASSLVRKWPDWLVNDTERPEKRRKTFTTYQHYTGNEPLFPSGLIGPVKILTLEQVKISGGE